MKRIYEMEVHVSVFYGRYQELEHMLQIEGMTSYFLTLQHLHVQMQALI